jgi:hypothetical protein
MGGGRYNSILSSRGANKKMVKEKMSIKKKYKEKVCMRNKNIYMSS